MLYTQGDHLMQRKARNQQSAAAATSDGVAREAIFAESAIEQHSDKVHRINAQPKPSEVDNFLKQALVKVPMITDVDPRQLQRLVDAMENFRLQPRQVAVRSGEPNDYIYVIQTGQVRVASAKDENVMQPGSTFGVTALSVGAPADFTATAAGAAQLWRLHRVVFKLLQMDYGAKLKSAIGKIVSQNRTPARKMLHMSPMQRIVAQARKQRGQQRIGHEGEFVEFADVPAAVAACDSVRTLGKGNFGEVTLVVHGPTRTAYAKKVQAAEGKKRANIDREIAAMREGGSPFLVRFYGEFSETSFGSPMSTMLLEYLGGGDLQSVMSKHGMWASGGNKGFEEEHARFYFACVVSALDGMHAAGWMHRDVKLENVVVDNAGYAKLIDCGLAKRLGDSEHTYTMSGTPAYYAPELVKSTGYGHKAEIWAAGILLHELICGDLPFEPPPDTQKKPSDKLIDLFKLIVQSSPKLVDQHERPHIFTASAKDLITMMLKKKAVERISIAELRRTVFFERFNWDAFSAQRMPAPFVPARDAALPAAR
jgi:CRP-like cAMP-binding protein